MREESVGQEGEPLPASTTEPLPEFLRELAAHAAAGDCVLAEPLQPVPRRWAPRQSAVLVLLSGRTLEDAHLVVEERGHRMRSQPGQFSLPGGGREEGDADAAATALREAREEIGLDASAVRVLGSFAPVPMPWREHEVHPVIAWAPQMPPLRVADPREVERVEIVPLVGPDSLTDPGCRFIGSFDGRAVGAVFSLSRERFVWGFTAMLIERVLDLMGLGIGGPSTGSSPDGPIPAAPPRIEIPAARRREGSRAPRRA